MTRDAGSRTCAVALVALTLFSAPFGDGVGSLHEAPIASDGKKVKMPTVVPDSRSVILRSTHILLIRIDSSDAGQWEQDPSGNLVRQVRLGVHLEQILKGEVEQKEGTSLRIEVKQFGRPGTRYYAVAGVWSDQPIQTLTRLVSFSSTTSKDAAGSLVEPSCKLILPAKSALADVRVALKAEKNKLSLSDTLKLAEPSAGILGYLLPEYLAAKYEGSLASNVEEFSSLMRFIEYSQLAVVARTALLDSAVADVGEARSPSPQILLSLVATLFHLLAMSEAAGIHDNIVEVYLPEALRLDRGAGRFSASQVFQLAPSERAKAEAVLNGYHGTARTEGLKEWLKR